jgi:hypothetical protein
MRPRIASDQRDRAKEFPKRDQTQTSPLRTLLGQDYQLVAPDSTAFACPVIVDPSGPSAPPMCAKFSFNLKEHRREGLVSDFIMIRLDSSFASGKLLQVRMMQCDRGALFAKSDKSKMVLSRREPEPSPAR